MPTSSVNYHFGSVGNAAGGGRAETHIVSGTLAGITVESIPTVNFSCLCFVWRSSLAEYRNAMSTMAQGEFTSKTFKKRFGPWSDTLKHYDKWKKDGGAVDLELASKPSLDQQMLEPLMEPESCQRHISYSNGSVEPPQLYGEPIDFRGLRHAPINEQGVVYLFGMVSRDWASISRRFSRDFQTVKASTFTMQKRTCGPRRESNSSSGHLPSRDTDMIRVDATWLYVGSTTGPIAPYA